MTSLSHLVGFLVTFMLYTVSHASGEPLSASEVQRRSLDLRQTCLRAAPGYQAFACLNENPRQVACVNRATAVCDCLVRNHINLAQAYATTADQAHEQLDWVKKYLDYSPNRPRTDGFSLDADPFAIEPMRLEISRGCLRNPRFTFVPR